MTQCATAKTGEYPNIRFRNIWRIFFSGNKIHDHCSPRDQSSLSVKYSQVFKTAQVAKNIWRIINTIGSIWREIMQRHFFLDITCSSKLNVRGQISGHIFEPSAGYSLCIGPRFVDFISCLWYFHLSFIASCSQKVVKSLIFSSRIYYQRSILMCRGAVWTAFVQFHLSRRLSASGHRSFWQKCHTVFPNHGSYDLWKRRSALYKIPRRLSGSCHESR